MEIPDKKVFIVVGHYGSGKTEFSVNLSLFLKKQRGQCALFDLDIVNPYFRSREKADILEQFGVRVNASALASSGLDIPAVSPQIYTLFDDPTVTGVLDMGGDAIGAHALAGFRERADPTDCAVLLVVNANRPNTRTAEQVVSCLREIESAVKLPCAALVNNTHLCGHTDAEQVKKGDALVSEVSRRTGLPVLCHAVEKTLAPACHSLSGPVFPIRLFMRKPWEL